MEDLTLLDNNDFFDSLPKEIFEELRNLYNHMDPLLTSSKLEYWLSLRNFLLLYRLPHKIKENLPIENNDEVIALSQYYWLEKYDKLHQLIFGQSDDWLRKIRIYVIETCSNFDTGYNKIKKIHYYIQENVKTSDEDKKNILHSIKR